ncbi:mRNA processing protein [Aulographum hederae CBS 113979]|uniref:mRNA processing protein n=1 Tax=Aulographum hederae CBS 113979 TaxID=1176131 RepID=A0A6G1GZE7_9PEZI|nr:mRNA processing protein [Aulographum hederae CBS 113979]
MPHMPAGYTCRQCLAALRRNVRPLSHETARPWASSRWSSSKAFKPPPSQSPAQPRRNISFTGAQTPASSSGSPIPSGSAAPASEERAALVLREGNLFHPFSSSPSPDIRRRAAYIKQHAYCPHPDHRQTRNPTQPDDPEARKPMSGGVAPAHVRYECPDCGIPVYCCEEHWADDFENHLELCDVLRQINEDDHDLRSGRRFNEFEMAGAQMDDAQINMTNWDTLLYTREFDAVNDNRAMRQLTKLLTYPTTIGTILHETSPYHIRKGGRLTVEGLKSFSALRYSLHPPKSGAGMTIKGLRPNPPPVRLFILGARAESSLPRSVWLQLAHMFPRATFHLIFIGPESMTNRDSEFPLPERTPSNPFGRVMEDRFSSFMKISTYVDYYHTLHEASVFQPFDPYFDSFVLFHPGLGHPASSHEWERTLPQLLETKVPIIATGYTEWDMQRDLDWVQQKMGGEVDILLEPGENRFRSLRWDLNDLDPVDVSAGNWGVWSFRGKRYEAAMKD